MKDPAFLFYPGDWLGGTMLLTRHQKGCYMDILMAQFNTGHLSLDQIKLLLGPDYSVWATLQSKFRQDPAGLWFNEKLETEIIKRKNYSKSRSENRKKTYEQSYDNTHDKSYDKHMENVNINEDLNKNRKGVQGENNAVVDAAGADCNPPNYQSPAETIDQIKSDDPADFFSPGTDQIRMEHLFMSLGLPWEEIESIFTQFQQKRIRLGEFLTRKQHWAAWTGYCNTYAQNQRKEAVVKDSKKSGRDKLIGMIN